MSNFSPCYRLQQKLKVDVQNMIVLVMLVYFSLHMLSRLVEKVKSLHFGGGVVVVCVFVSSLSVCIYQTTLPVSSTNIRFSTVNLTKKNVFLEL